MTQASTKQMKASTKQNHVQHTRTYRLVRPGGSFPAIVSWTMRPFRLRLNRTGLTAFREKPLAVVFPETADEVIAAVRWCHEHAVPFVARGSGTSLSGGSLPVADGIVIALNRLKKILQLDPEQRIAVVQPGVVNLDVSAAAATLRIVLRPRSIQSNDLHDRRQRRLQFRRCALPEIRHDLESRAGPESRARQRGSRHDGGTEPGGRRPRLHRLVLRQRRPVWHRVGNHAAVAAETGNVPYRFGRLQVVASRRRCGLGHHRLGAVARRDGNHGCARRSKPPKLPLPAAIRPGRSPS